MAIGLAGDQCITGSDQVNRAVALLTRGEDAWTTYPGIRPPVRHARGQAPGEWGNLLGLDRIPEVRTLRGKLELLCRKVGQAVPWNTLLAKEWMLATGPESDLVFYVDGHVRVYTGELTELPRH